MKSQILDMNLKNGSVKNDGIFFGETLRQVLGLRCTPLPQLLLPLPPSAQTLRRRTGDGTGELLHPTWEVPVIGSAPVGAPQKMANLW